MNAQTSFRVERWTAASRGAVVAVGAIALGLAVAPIWLGPGAMDRLTILFVYLILAAMWNALAGYAGLVSVGQQLFFGLGAYFTVKFADLGANPFLAMVLAAAA
ncbi:MAG TPA: branched-chain amino acid ABC transporter permease, partial [Devosiaceae bacterium]|nr:branched-chain amino acid ABC transporter permease [Devosiaceae bacterium]